VATDPGSALAHSAAGSPGLSGGYARGVDCPAGSRVKVARVDGPLLMVETIETDA